MLLKGNIMDCLSQRTTGHSDEVTCGALAEGGTLFLEPAVQGGMARMKALPILVGGQ